MRVARENRRRMDAAGVLAINITSAPGSGKTALLERTIPALGPEARCAVLVGDLQTTRDAERLGAVAAETVQINTGRGCHLSAPQVNEGLDSLDLSGIQFPLHRECGEHGLPGRGGPGRAPAGGAAKRAGGGR